MTTGYSKGEIATIIFLGVLAAMLYFLFNAAQIAHISLN